MMSAILMHNSLFSWFEHWRSCTILVASNPRNTSSTMKQQPTVYVIIDLWPLDKALSCLCHYLMVFILKFLHTGNEANTAIGIGFCGVQKYMVYSYCSYFPNDRSQHNLPYQLSASQDKLASVKHY